MNNTTLNLEGVNYHRDTTRISKSGLDLINRAPAHYYERYLNPKAIPQKETPALIIGSAVHCAVLEPKEFGKRYAVGPRVDKRTKAGKEEWEQFLQTSAGYIQLDSETATLCERIMEAVRAFPASKYFLKEGTAEQTITWTDEAIGVDCKARLDWLTPDNIIVDLKTTDDASPRGFAQSVRKYRYDVQAAFYSDGLEQATGRTCEGFFFIAVEKSAPFLCAVYYISADDIQEAREKYQKNLLTYRMCKESGIWNGYSEIVTKLEIWKP
jgi:exodeoxyribonuclease VIII